jgi:DNA polymerase II small subunit
MSGKSSAKIRENAFNSINMELDDLESTLTVIFPGKNEELIKKVNRIMVDQVICIEGFITEDKKMIASNCLRPDIPNQERKKHEIPPVSVVFISDLHFGSKYFLADKFEAFINWLHGKNDDESQKELATAVKYIIIAGDLIDGVGVYPGQEKNLAVVDITEQYNLAASYLKRIPGHIKIIISPGGPHDAVRKAYPQPALEKKYASALYSLENVILLGNPAQIQLHGINILLFHGDSLDDLIQAIPHLSYDKPADIMKELLITRHLTPIYGSSTWIAPEREDWMVIEDIPEILHCGHTHVSDYKEYRGVIMLNSGTFQAETDYQQSLGIQPTPGKIPLINLQTLAVNFLQF